jgi:hypothetical protein
MPEPALEVAAFGARKEAGDAANATQETGPQEMIL